MTMRQALAAYLLMVAAIVLLCAVLSTYRGGAP